MGQSSKLSDEGITSIWVVLSSTLPEPFTPVTALSWSLELYPNHYAWQWS